MYNDDIFKLDFNQPFADVIMGRCVTTHDLLTFVEKRASIGPLKAFSFVRDFVNFFVENESEILFSANGMGRWKDESHHKKLQRSR